MYYISGWRRPTGPPARRDTRGILRCSTATLVEFNRPQRGLTPGRRFEQSRRAPAGFVRTSTAGGLNVPCEVGAPVASSGRLPGFGRPTLILCDAGSTRRPVGPSVAGPSVQEILLMELLENPCRPRPAPEPGLWNTRPAATFPDCPHLQECRKICQKAKLCSPICSHPDCPSVIRTHSRGIAPHPIPAKTPSRGHLGS